MSDRVKVSRRLYLSALADAIDWEDSLLATHNPQIGVVPGCCTPGARCGDYQRAARLLADYRRAYAALLPDSSGREQG